MASERNKAHLATGKVQLFEAPMERALNLSCIDLIFSIYAIGWTLNPSATFRNLAMYLRPGGRFIWSWGHPLFPEVEYVDDRFLLPSSYSYFNEKREYTARWCGTEGAVIQNRMLSSWVRDLTNAGFVVRQLLEPEAESCPPWVFNNNRSIPMVKARILPTTLIFICDKV
jgi:SAM-dependent methyltransferase